MTPKKKGQEHDLKGKASVITRESNQMLYAFVIHRLLTMFREFRHLGAGFDRCGTLETNTSRGLQGKTPGIQANNTLPTIAEVKCMLHRVRTAYDCQEEFMRQEDLLSCRGVEVRNRRNGTNSLMR